MLFLCAELWEQQGQKINANKNNNYIAVFFENDEKTM